ncbi:hypothetical protein PAHAL_8G208200 [Panicum hallii]|uniref:Knottin scorpion toxin-like domain-containing protein n=1 Tax=Panicum hallii TaxID=206008 RepID=A0A2S3IET7_9POAL|nr:hypothetical protein PAHAL_8G208200 [Panicum hallii]
MSSNTKLAVVVGLSLAFLHVASFGEAAPCGEERTGVPCTSDAMCKALCTGKEKAAGYTDGRCSLEFIVGDPSCVCSKPCAAGRP